MRAQSRHALGHVAGGWLLVLALLAACKFDPTPRPGGVLCGPGGACPEGLTCNHARGLCCARGDCGRDAAAEARDPVDQAPDPSDPPPIVDAGAETAGDARADAGDAQPYMIRPPECEPTASGACGVGRTCVHACGPAPGVVTAVCKPSGGLAEGASCSVDEDCASTFSCVDMCAARACVRRCRTDVDCGAGRVCYSLPCGNAGVPYGYCSPVCDPIGMTSGCPSPAVCRLFRADLAYCTCRAPDPNAGGDGAACKTPLECREGHLCALWEGAGKCRKVCRFGGTDCPMGMRCQAMPDQSRFGGCVPEATPDPPCDPALKTSCTDRSCEGYCAMGVPRTQCSLVANQAKLDGSPCTGVGECRPGSLCINMRSCRALVAYCRPICKSDEDCGGGTSRCRGESFQCPGGTEAPFRTCTWPCEPTGATSGCPAGSYCRLGPREVTNCVCAFEPGQPRGGDGDACEAVPCGPGLTCAQESSRRACRPICRIDAPAACPAGRKCTPLPDQRSFGACAP